MASPNKPHAVLVPFPSQGHINPFMQVAKLLHSRGFYITFANTDFNHSRLIRSKGPDFVKGLPDFRFESFPDGLPPSDPDATQDLGSLSDSARKYMLGPFRDLLAKLNSLPGVPPVTCVIPDGFMCFGIKAAQELGIAGVPFWTASACGFMAYLYFGELIKRGLVPFKDENFATNGDLETPVDWIPGMKDIRLKDIPVAIRTTSHEGILLNCLRDEVQDCLTAPAILFNTFYDFEWEVLEAIRERYPNFYNIGPLSLLQRHIPESPVQSLKPSLWKEDTKCLDWLDKRAPNSVVFVNYGSITIMSDKHFQEFAWGLANSKQPFLWIVRPDMVTGSSPVLSAEYYEEIKDRGLLMSWCPQEKVLSHPSLGVFLTHCGWNSLLETICGGVPVLCWPYLAEQTTNCRLSCTVWGIGMEVDHDVKRGQVEALVKEMITGEKGKKMREKTLEWKKKAEEAAQIGGPSYNDFNRFLKEILLHEN